MIITVEVEDRLVEALKTLRSDIDFDGDVCYTENHNSEDLLYELGQAKLLEEEEGMYYLSQLGRVALQQAGGKA
jgi:hypothetical protein